MPVRTTAQRFLRNMAEQFSKLTRDGSILQMWTKVLEVEDGLQVHERQMPQDLSWFCCRINGGASRQARQSASQGPFEVSDLQLGRYGNQQRLNPFFVDGVNDNERMIRDDQGLDVVDGGRETHGAPKNTTGRLGARS